MLDALVVFQDKRGSLKSCSPAKTPSKLLTLPTHQFPITGPYLRLDLDFPGVVTVLTYSTTARLSREVPLKGKQLYVLEATRGACFRTSQKRKIKQLVEHLMPDLVCNIIRQEVVSSCRR